jgi:uncharacterized repeat protein (TIGR03803 family)
MGMICGKLHRVLRRTDMKKVAFCAIVLVVSICSMSAQQYKVLYSFAGYPTDAGYPVGNLVSDRAGSIFGTASNGTLGHGAVFRLSPNSEGTWTESLIYNFCADDSNGLCLDGAYPQAGLAFDAQGNLYGTTEGGGSQAACGSGQSGCGTVFELSPPSAPGGNWTEAVLYNFCSVYVEGICVDGNSPISAPVVDASGNVYGTTTDGGTGRLRNGGTVFELSQGSGGWTETVLYSFCSLGEGNFCPDGHSPYAGATFDRLGNLYGTTYEGGSEKSEGGGTVYKLSPGSSGWTETVVDHFLLSGQYGGAPLGEVSFDPQGNLYSTTSLGARGVGTVFEIRVNGQSRSFSFDRVDGAVPAAGVFVDARTKALYGTTTGNIYTHGNVFQINASGQETVLYDFCQQPNCTDGSAPFSGLISDEAGNLYGTTEFGGANDFGVVFEVTP